MKIFKLLSNNINLPKVNLGIFKNNILAIFTFHKVIYTYLLLIYKHTIYPYHGLEIKYKQLKIIFLKYFVSTKVYFPSSLLTVTSPYERNILDQFATLDFQRPDA